MEPLDIILTRVCATCQTSTNLRYVRETIILRDYGQITCRIDPDEFALCPTCGQPLQLAIRIEPFSPVNHQHEHPVYQWLYMNNKSSL